MACSAEKGMRLTPSMIPDSLNFDVKKSSFFGCWGQLPSPKDVRERAKAQQAKRVNPDDSTVHAIAAPYVRPPPALFEEMGLFVKWGSAVQISEAQCLYAISRFFKGFVPAPEVYGWRTDGEEKFIYMEYVRGRTLEQVWDNMEPEDRVRICRELRRAFDHLRQFEQDPQDKFIGNIVRAPLYDRSLHINFMSEAGPFMSVSDFHDWFTFLYRRPMPDPHSIPVEPFRQDLPDNCAIKFTHGDLHRSNIIVTPSRPYHAVAIVDWEQSGWLPAYWEARKAQYTADRQEEWSTKYLPMVLDQYSDTWDAWDYYTSAMGC